MFGGLIRLGLAGLGTVGAAVEEINALSFITAPTVYYRLL